MTARQVSFTGGIDQISAEVEIPDNAFKLLINARNRFGYLEPVKKHVEFATAPAGLKQGIIGVGNVLIMFVAGFAYYQVDGTTTWTKIDDFHLLNTAAQFWSIAVPASSFNFIRKAGASVNVTIDVVNTKVHGIPQAILVQDGVSQPWIIIYDTVNQIFTARVTQNFAQWVNTPDAIATTREYVPVGREMSIIGPTLHIIAPDRKSVYRSITGRYLDFMINVTPTGDKAATEAEGGAFTVSYSFDFEEITCLMPLNIPDSFIYGTANTARILTADFNTTVFDEPTFVVSALIEAGIVNQYSALEIIGDYALIDFEGVKSFNAVQQLKIEGNVDIFSLPLSKMLEGIRQKNCSCVKINNYGLFNLDTIYGNVFAIYDMLRNKWTAIDITAALKIKQFAITKTDEFFKLYAISFDDRLYQLYADNTHYFAAKLHTRSYAPESVKAEHQSSWFKPMFTKGTINGTMTLTEYVDNQRGAILQMPLNTSIGPVKYPVRGPVSQASISNTDNPGFQLKDGIKGKQISYVLEWNTDHKLVMFELGTQEDISIPSAKQSNKIIQDTYGS